MRGENSGNSGDNSSLDDGANSGAVTTLSEVGELINDEPSVDENAINKEAENNAANVDSDIFGEPINREENNNATPNCNSFTADDTVYDSRIHTAGKDGKGTRNQNGKYRRRKNARNGTSNTGTGTSEQDRIRIEQCKQAGRAVAGSIVVLIIGIGGEEFKTKVEPTDEMAMLSEAWGDYFISQGVTTIPPWAMLLVAHGMYVAPRLTMPTTKTRLQKLYTYSRGYIKRYFGV